MDQKDMNKRVGGVVGQGARKMVDEADKRGHKNATIGAGGGGLLGAMLGSFGGPIGAAIGAAIGGAAGYRMGRSKDIKEREGK